MNDKKFKIGDTVRIIKCSSIEAYELNKVGTIVSIQDYARQDCVRWATYVVDMGRPRRSREPEQTCWYLQEDMIELAPKPNEQLLFNFMY